MSEINLEQARFNMIEQQVRTWEVLDQNVLDIMAAVPRERYVPDRYRSLAFADVRIPLAHHETMMTPNVEGRVLQAVAVREGESVLEVGTGSGYLTACLAQQAGEVVSVDIHSDFTRAATERLNDEGVQNVLLTTGNAAHDWGDERLFDVVVLTGSLPALFDSWRHRIKVGGRLFAIIGDGAAMEALLVTRREEGLWDEESLFETELARLRNAELPATFEF